MSESIPTGLIHPSTKAQAENKKKVFALLGGKCSWRDENGSSCCWGPQGEPCDDPHALVIDHMQAGGEKERRKGYGAGNAFYVRVLRHLKALPPGIRSDKYQLLCANHNMIKRFDGREALGRKQHKKPWNPASTGAIPDTINNMTGQQLDIDKLKKLLNLDELKKQTSTLGFTKIRRQVDGSTVLPLATWNGFSTESGSGFSHVAVWFRIDGNKVTVIKAGEPDSYYLLS